MKSHFGFIINTFAVIPRGKFHGIILGKSLSSKVELLLFQPSEFVRLKSSVAFEVCCLESFQCLH